MWRRTLLNEVAATDSAGGLVRRFSFLERRLERSARRYVAGRTLDDAVEVVETLAVEGAAATVELLGEHVDEPMLARAAARRYVELARRLVELPARTRLEVDPTHLGLDVAPRLAQGLILEVCEALPPGRFLQVGAKDDGRRMRVLELVLAARENRAPVWATVQANLRSSPQIAARLADADVPVRLVKGAYAGPPTVAYPWGEQTDLAYLRVAEALAARGAQFSLATHDPVIRESCLGRWPGLPVEMLYGVRPDDRRALVTRGVDVRVYVPFGDDWFRYFVRRIGEAQRAR